MDIPIDPAKLLNAVVAQRNAALDRSAQLEAAVASLLAELAQREGGGVGAEASAVPAAGHPAPAKL